MLPAYLVNPVLQHREFDTEVAATVLRVEHPTACVRVLGSDQEAGIFLVNPSGPDLAGHVGGTAIFKGRGAFLVDSDRFYRPVRMLWFDASSYRLIENRPLRETFDLLAAAAGGIWDHVDPSKPLEDQDD